MSQKVVGTQLHLTRATLFSRSKWFLLLLFFLLFVLARPSTGQVSAYSYTKTDTIRAIQRLFDYKRTGGRFTTAVGGSLALIGAGAGLFSSAAVTLINLGKTKNEILPITLASSVPGLILTGFGIARLIRYSRRREDVLIDAYEFGEPLPAFIQRKLRPRYFSAYY